MSSCEGRGWGLVFLGEAIIISTNQNTFSNNIQWKGIFLFFSITVAWFFVVANFIYSLSLPFLFKKFSFLNTIYRTECGRCLFTVSYTFCMIFVFGFFSKCFLLRGLSVFFVLEIGRLYVFFFSCWMHVFIKRHNPASRFLKLCF